MLLLLESRCHKLTTGGPYNCSVSTFSAKETLDFQGISSPTGLLSWTFHTFMVLRNVLSICS